MIGARTASAFAIGCLVWALCVHPTLAQSREGAANNQATANALTPRDVLDRAVASYESAQAEQDRSRRLEQFRDAERLFARAAENGTGSASLYANIGTSALQAERLGPAIRAYRRALALEPGLARASQNLTHARGLLPGWVPTPESGGAIDTFFFWHETVPHAARVRGASLACITAALCFAIAIYRRSSAFAWLAAVPSTLWLALLVSLAIDPAADIDREGVVIAPEVVARASDSRNAPALFGNPLPEGTEFEILESRDGWMHIRLHNGRTAWVDAAGVAAVGWTALPEAGA